MTCLQTSGCTLHLRAQNYLKSYLAIFLSHICLPQNLFQTFPPIVFNLSRHYLLNNCHLLFNKDKLSQRNSFYLYSYICMHISHLTLSHFIHKMTFHLSHTVPSGLYYFPLPQKPQSITHSLSPESSAYLSLWLLSLVSLKNTHFSSIL
jgi:hypothetical protein